MKAKAKTNSTKDNLKETIGKIFTDVANERTPIKKAVGFLYKLQTENSFSLLRSALRHCIDLFLILPQAPSPTGTPGDKILKLIMEFVVVGKGNFNKTQEEIKTKPQISTINTTTTIQRRVSSGGISFTKWENDEFGQFLIRYVLSLSSAGDKNIRIRVCQIISMLLETCNYTSHDLFNDDIDDLLSSVLLKMQERLRDKNPNVREFALKSLRRLQRPSLGTDDAIHSQFLTLMKADPDERVRFVAVSNVAFSKNSISELIERTRDISEIVRNQARHALRKVPFTELTPPNRILLLDSVSSLENPKEFEDLLFGCWIPSVEGNILKILEGVDVSTNEEKGEKIIRSILKKSPAFKMSCKIRPTETHSEFTTVFSISIIGNNQNDSTSSSPPKEPIQLDMLSNELSLLWRVFCEYFNDPLSDNLDDVIPELSLICEMARQTINQPFICRQLLILIHSIDLFDEVGRKCLGKLLETLIPEMADHCEVVTVAIDNFKRLHNDEDEWTRLIVQLLADLKDPIDEETENQTQKELGTNGNKEEENLIPEGKKSSIWRGCLNITSRFLEKTKKTLRDPLISGLLESVILPTVTYKEPSVRILAIKALGLYCLLGRSAAKEYLFLFLKVLEHDISEIKKIALQVLLDVIISHGTAALNITDTLSLETMSRSSWSDDEAQERALIAIVSCLTDSNLRSIAAEGLAKLFFVGTLSCSEVFARLVVLNFDPIASEDIRLKTCLSTFLPAYVFSRRFHEKHQLVAEKSFIPAILWAQSCNISRGKTSQNNNVIPILNVSCYLQKLTGDLPIQITRKINSQQHDSQSHIRMAIALISHLFAHPKQANTLIDIFLGFDLKFDSFDDSNDNLVKQFSDKLSQLVSKKEIQAQPVIMKKLSYLFPNKNKIATNSTNLQQQQQQQQKPKETNDKNQQKRTRTEESEEEQEQPNKKPKSVEKDDNKKVNVVFAGFQGNEETKLLSEQIRELGGEITGEDEALDSNTTHLIHPERSITTKTLAASLLGYWLMTPNWIEQSMSAGEFVDERKAGGKRFEAGNGPLIGKKVLIHESYQQEPRFDMSLHHLLIENVGHGQIVSGFNSNKVDFVLVSRSMPLETRNELETKFNSKTFDRSQFFKFLIP